MAICKIHLCKTFLDMGSLGRKGDIIKLCYESWRIVSVGLLILAENRLVILHLRCCMQKEMTKAVGTYPGKHAKRPVLCHEFFPLLLWWALFFQGRLA